MTSGPLTLVSLITRIYEHFVNLKLWLLKLSCCGVSCYEEVLWPCGAFSAKIHCHHSLCVIQFCGSQLALFSFLTEKSVQWQKLLAGVA
jgi:hypothetical protein